jgi:beta-glucosidase
MASTPLYQNPRANVEERIRDLLGRMTLEEKAAQMDQYHGCLSFADRTFPTHHTAMARDGGRLVMERVERILGDRGVGCIHDLYPPDAEPINQLQRYARERTRLGIPILFSEEALHGLCGPGNTIFPQAIALAATWNRDLVRRTGQAIARELRAYGIHESFSPVLDIAREPRWGRQEETFGEEPHLAARLGVAIVQGMQGGNLARDDAIVAEPKHFAAHGISRGGLNTASAHCGERELRTVHLAPFEAAVREGGARGIMVAYHSIDGIPCSSNPWLLTEVLREEWGFRGLVRSDLGAVRRLDWAHRTAADLDTCIRQSVEAGLDMQYYDFDHAAYQESIVRQVREGRLAESAVDRAVAAVLRVKFELGLFEQPLTDPRLVAARVRCPEHAAVALAGAREAITLLRNENHLLPLRPGLRRIAVLGPNAAAARLGDYSPTVHGFEPVTVLAGLRARVGPATEILHVQGCGVLARELHPIPGARLFHEDGVTPGLRGEYFANLDLVGKPVVTRADSEINHNWAFTAPAGGVPINAFSVRWTGLLVPDETFDGYLGTSSLDSMRLWVDDRLLTDGWGRGRNTNTNLGHPFHFEKGRAHRIRVEYKRDHSGIQIVLGWNHGDDDLARAVEAARNADVAIVCVGDSRETCGEGRERTSLSLPGRQHELVRAVHATGTPVVLVVQAGRAMTLGWEAENVPAILHAWFPGEQGGTAIAEALCGDINPGGRLPLTFPRSLGQLPLYLGIPRYGTSGYIDGDREPLYPFGFGLSYTTFAYANLRADRTRLPAGESLVVSVDVTNSGGRAGDEVVQLYLSDRVSSVVRPDRELAGFERIHLAAGETRTVSFTLGPAAMRLLDRGMHWVVEPGMFDVFVGGDSRASLALAFEVTR